jgi:hypothetical protein
MQSEVPTMPKSLEFSIHINLRRSNTVPTPLTMKIDHKTRTVAVVSARRSEYPTDAALVTGWKPSHIRVVLELF